MAKTIRFDAKFQLHVMAECLTRLEMKMHICTALTETGCKTHTLFLVHMFHAGSWRAV